MQSGVESLQMLNLKIELKRLLKNFHWYMTRSKCCCKLTNDSLSFVKASGQFSRCYK
jgi:hypothetical protein